MVEKNDFVIIFFEENFDLGCTLPYDPEGLLGAIPTMFLAFLGVQAGRILGLK
jgi:predicted acyltransferase